ncbi:MAG TPA: MoaD/ThiS family protein [Candidatus Nanopelagicales bacterium]|jgi:molybdopterin converting factor small subunit|nr:MoaD/ThiS family protein [Candidatus Nanopelagicales bacterium]
MTVQVRYWAAARAAAGSELEEYAGAATLADLLAAITERHAGGGLPAVLARCSYLVDEVSPGTRDPAQVQLAEAALVEVLPPFAGG